MPKKSKPMAVNQSNLQPLFIFLMGMGVGVLATYPVVGAHPLRYGGLLIVVGLGGYFFPMIKRS